MEYKIGQRVKHVDAEFYIESIVGDAAIIGDEEITHIVRLDGLSPLYKPGDPVRVKSREEIGKCHTNEYLDEVAGKVFTLSIDHGNNTYWDIEELHKWCIHENELEWYSGVEDKPDVQLYPNPETSNYGEWLLPEAMIKGIAKVWQDELAPVDFLPAEVHQDKDRNRSALAEVLKIKEVPQQLWKCPYYDNHTHRPCNETGSKHDIRQHSKTAHGEALPPTNSPVWEHWRVS